MPFYTYPLIYLISILVGIANFKKFSQNKYLVGFLLFLIYTFFSEIVGVYLSRFLHVRNNIVYNIWPIVNVLFFLNFFLSRITNKTKRIIIYVFMIGFISETIFQALFINHFINDLFLVNNMISKLIIAISAIIYFTELLESDSVLNIKNSLFFWISFGVFLYNLVFLPAFILLKYVSYLGMFQYITLGLNIIMHLCFITGFIISKKEFNN